MNENTPGEGPPTLPAAPAAPGAPPGRRAPRRGPAIAAALALLAFAAWKLVPLVLGPGTALLEAERRDLTRSLAAGGRIGQSARLPLVATVTGRVNKLPFSEGEHVQPGEVVLELDTPQDALALTQARNAHDEAREALRRLQEGQAVASARQHAASDLQLQQAQRELERSRALADKGFMSQAAVENAERRLQALQPVAPLAPLAPPAPTAPLPPVAAAPGSAAGDMDAALAAVERARAALEAAQQRLDAAVLRSPVAGRVVKLAVERGAPVQAGQEVLVIEPDGAIDIELRVNAMALRFLRVGQPAVATVELEEPQRFEAHVAFIDSAFDADQGTMVRLAVPAPPEGLKGGMATQVRIELERRQNTVVVPETALRDVEARPWVLVVVNGVAERREVRVGLQGDDGIEIIEGVEPGEWLVSTSTPGIGPGDKVRAQ